MSRQLAYNPGTLARESGSSDYHLFVRGYGSATARGIAGDVHHLIVVTDPILSPAKYSQAYALSRLYHLPGQTPQDKKALIVSILSIIANSANWNVMRPWSEASMVCETAGITLRIVEVSYEEFKILVREDERYHLFLAYSRADLAQLLSKTNLIFILSCCMLLANYKNLNEANYSNWMTARVRTFSGKVGDTYTPDHLLPSQYPPLDQVVAMQGFCSANHSLRKFIFLQILSIATGTQSFIQVAFAEIHHVT